MTADTVCKCTMTAHAVCDRGRYVYEKRIKMGAPACAAGRGAQATECRAGVCMRNASKWVRLLVLLKGQVCG